MIDTHCHLSFPQLFDRLDEVVEAARQAGVTGMISVGTRPDDWQRVRAIAEQYDDVYFTAGIHPHYATEAGADAIGGLLNAADHPRCVAFGEMGVDYHYADPPPRVQHDFFRGQLQAIAQSKDNRPIVIHCRKAVDDTLAIIRESCIPGAGARFVFHCFTEPPEDARKVLDAGAMISFTGIVTYKNAPEVRESAKLVPDDRIMVETDAPYLTPEPHRKIRTNEPRYVVDTARFLAELRGMSFEKFVELTDANAARFYGVGSRSGG